MVMNGDLTYEKGVHESYWPPFPWFAGYIFRWKYVPKHAGAWRFSCSDSYGNPRELAFVDPPSKWWVCVRGQPCVMRSHPSREWLKQIVVVHVLAMIVIKFCVISPRKMCFYACCTLAMLNSCHYRLLFLHDWLVNTKFSVLCTQAVRQFSVVEMRLIAEIDRLT